MIKIEVRSVHLIDIAIGKVFSMTSMSSAQKLISTLVDFVNPVMPYNDETVKLLWEKLDQQIYACSQKTDRCVCKITDDYVLDYLPSGVFLNDDIVPATAYLRSQSPSASGRSKKIYRAIRLNDSKLVALGEGIYKGLNIASLALVSLIKLQVSSPYILIPEPSPLSEGVLISAWADHDFSWYLKQKYPLQFYMNILYQACQGIEFVIDPSNWADHVGRSLGNPNPENLMIFNDKGGSPQAKWINFESCSELGFSLHNREYTVHAPYTIPTEQIVNDSEAFCCHPTADMCGIGFMILDIVSTRNPRERLCAIETSCFQQSAQGRKVWKSWREDTRDQWIKSIVRVLREDAVLSNLNWLLEFLLKNTPDDRLGAKGACDFLKSMAQERIDAWSRIEIPICNGYVEPSVPLPAVDRIGFLAQPRRFRMRPKLLCLHPPADKAYLDWVELEHNTAFLPDWTPLQSKARRRDFSAMVAQALSLPGSNPKTISRISLHKLPPVEYFPMVSTILEGSYNPALMIDATYHTKTGKLVSHFFSVHKGSSFLQVSFQNCPERYNHDTRVLSWVKEQNIGGLITVDLKTASLFLAYEGVPLTKFLLRYFRRGMWLYYIQQILPQIISILESLSHCGSAGSISLVHGSINSVNVLIDLRNDKCLVRLSGFEYATCEGDWLESNPPPDRWYMKPSLIARLERQEAIIARKNTDAYAAVATILYAFAPLEIDSCLRTHGRLLNHRVFAHRLAANMPAQWSEFIVRLKSISNTTLV